MIACEVFVIVCESVENKLHYLAENYVTDEYDMLLDTVPYWADFVTNMEVNLYDTRKEAIQALKSMVQNLPTNIEIKKDSIGIAKVTTIVHSLQYPKGTDVELPPSIYSLVKKEDY